MWNDACALSIAFVARRRHRSGEITDIGPAFSWLLIVWSDISRAVRPDVDPAVA